MKRLLLALACSIGIGMTFSANAVNNGGGGGGGGGGKAACYTNVAQAANNMRLGLIAAGVNPYVAAVASNAWYNQTIKNC